MIPEAKRFVAASRSLRTREEYAKQWKAFRGWCDKEQLAPLPATPRTIARYIAYLADNRDLAASSIGVALAAISQAHRHAGHDSPDSPRNHPLVREVWMGIRQTKGIAPHPANLKTPLLTHQIVAISKSLPDTLGGVRDRALILLGFAGGFRRIELASLVVDDLHFTDDGLSVRSRSLAHGISPACPVQAIRAWLDVSGIESGPVFRGLSRGKNPRLSDRPLTGHGVAFIVKRAAKAAALDLNVSNISSRSLNSASVGRLETWDGKKQNVIAVVENLRTPTAK